MSIEEGAHKKCDGYVITSPRSIKESEKWLADLDGENGYNILYIYRSGCPYCRGFQGIITKFVTILCHVMKTRGKKLRIGNVDKAVVQTSEKWVRFAPTVPSLLVSTSSDGGTTPWIRLPSSGEATRTPLHLLMFVSKEWSLPELSPRRISFYNRVLPKEGKAILVDFLEDQDYPPTQALYFGSPHSSATQQTHDVLMKWISTPATNIILINRYHLPSSNPYHLTSLQDGASRDKKEPLLVDLRTQKILAKGSDVLNW